MDEQPKISNDISSAYELRTPRINLEEDVVLAPETRRMFEEAIGAMRHHKTIYTDWGFEAVDPMGRNMILNLYGPPGTGKTLAAEALAGTLERKYFHIGISEVESKYVGETAKNISAAFKTAALEGAVIFFDEADTLLGARLSSVTQGIDNEINAMRSTLLMELERFDGIVIFATNFAKNYDSAFVSRIRYHIEFKIPDTEGRKLLWQRMLVPGIPLDEERDEIIERCSIASDGLSGREIRTVLRTAFPRALVESDIEPKVKWKHFETAIEDVFAANRNVGKSRKDAVKKSNNNVTGIEVSQRLLGLTE
ncbi:ATP-binding protein [Shewanella sp. 5_MG-2023]|uniref:ATP-binding protein n=1 Tax=Shewanella sp. 5_MG-2023 TaxID=3062656 RepID=UPI0026E1D7BA|nr:ATP-binding protein [Shewanella sp. 5_MG-2023]MDO6639729.1 ATP-binding protein [Shewanella sp. 5_MG-2023]